MGFLPLLPSGGKSGRRMNYGISATSAIRWQKWQKDELFLNYQLMARKLRADLISSAIAPVQANSVPVLDSAILVVQYDTDTYYACLCTPIYTQL